MPTAIIVVEKSSRGKGTNARVISTHWKDESEAQNFISSRAWRTNSPRIFTYSTQEELDAYVNSLKTSPTGKYARTPEQQKEYYERQKAYGKLERTFGERGEPKEQQQKTKMKYVIYAYQKGEWIETPQGRMMTKGWQVVGVAKTREEAEKWLRLNPIDSSTKIEQIPEEQSARNQYQEWGGEGTKYIGGKKKTKTQQQKDDVQVAYGGPKHDATPKQIARAKKEGRPYYIGGKKYSPDSDVFTIPRKEFEKLKQAEFERRALETGMKIREKQAQTGTVYFSPKAFKRAEEVIGGKEGKGEFMTEEELKKAISSRYQRIARIKPVEEKDKKPTKTKEIVLGITKPEVRRDKETFKSEPQGKAKKKEPVSDELKSLFEFGKTIPVKELVGLGIESGIKTFGKVAENVGLGVKTFVEGISGVTAPPKGRGVSLQELKEGMFVKTKYDGKDTVLFAPPARLASKVASFGENVLSTAFTKPVEWGAKLREKYPPSKKTYYEGTAWAMSKVREGLSSTFSFETEYIGDTANTIKDAFKEPLFMQVEYGGKSRTIFAPPVRLATSVAQDIETKTKKAKEIAKATALVGGAVALNVLEGTSEQFSEKPIETYLEMELFGRVVESGKLKLLEWVKARKAKKIAEELTEELRGKPVTEEVKNIFTGRPTIKERLKKPTSWLVEDKRPKPRPVMKSKEMVLVIEPKPPSLLKVAKDAEKNDISLLFSFKELRGAKVRHIGRSAGFREVEYQSTKPIFSKPEVLDITQIEMPDIVSAEAEGVIKSKQKSVLGGMKTRLPQLLNRFEIEEGVKAEAVLKPHEAAQFGIARTNIGLFGREFSVVEEDLFKDINIRFNPLDFETVGGWGVKRQNKMIGFAPQSGQLGFKPLLGKGELKFNFVSEEPLVVEKYIDLRPRKQKAGVGRKESLEGIEPDIRTFTTRNLIGKKTRTRTRLIRNNIFEMGKGKKPDFIFGERRTMTQFGKHIIKVDTPKGYKLIDTRKGRTIFEVVKKQPKSAKPKHKTKKKAKTKKMREMEVGDSLLILEEPIEVPRARATETKSKSLSDAYQSFIFDEPRYQSFKFKEPKKGLFFFDKIFAEPKGMDFLKRGYNPLLVPFPKIKQPSILKSKQKPTIQAKPTQDNRIADIVTPVQPQKIDQTAGVSPIVDTITAQGEGVDLVQDVAQATDEITTQLTETEPTPPLLEQPLTEPLLEEPPPRRRTRFRIDFKKQKKAKGNRGYNVFVREGKTKRDKFVKANKRPLPKIKALNFGALAVDTTTARSFKIQRSRRKTNLRDDKDFILAGKFRKPKGRTKLPTGTYVEKSKYAIDSMGELLGIPYSSKKTKKMPNMLL